MSHTSSVNTIGPRTTRVDPVYANILIKKITPFLEFKSYPTGQRFNISKSHQEKCYVFRSGIISLVRQPDDILVELIEAPTFRGIIPVHPDSLSVYTIRIVEPVEMACIDLERLYELFSELQLWEYFSKHLQLVAGSAIEVLFKLTSPSVFDVVRLQLYELMSKPQEVRESISAETYIKSKTRVSRSAIMRVLSHLKSGGYIVIKKGILVEIKYIPNKY